MAGIGFRWPYIAQYVHVEGTNTVTYEKGMRLAKGVSLSTSMENNDDNNCYADDGVAETDKAFSSGTLTITTDDFEQPASAMVLGITPQEITVDGETVNELIYNDDMITSYLGLGAVIPKMIRGVRKYRALVFTKISFDIPGDAATTQGEKIEWQTPELTATIMRDDTIKKNWKREATFDSIENAEAYIKQALNIE